MNIIGDNKMSADQVIDTCTAVPNREEIFGKREDKATHHYWNPISHSKAVETILGGFEQTGIDVVDSNFALNKSGHMMVGGFRVQGDALPAMPDNVDGIHEMFFRHANDMSVSMQLNAGMNLFVCTNGMMTGEKIACRKHTVNFDFDKWIVDEALPGFITACGTLGEKVELLKSMAVNNKMAYETILEAGNQGIIPLARCVDVYREWKNPTFSRADFPSHTGWKLYNNFTHIAQKCSPQRQHQIIEQSYDLVTAIV